MQRPIEHDLALVQVVVDVGLLLHAVDVDLEVLVLDVGGEPDDRAGHPARRSGPAGDRVECGWRDESVLGVQAVIELLEERV
jgi:hypothetical protein